ncbi:MAG: aspartate aminotransferase family protein [Meiothermus sp.]|nr:aspartate aminotransferase family protein [Meiothermus sp.]
MSTTLSQPSALETAIGQAHRRYVQANPKSLEYHREAAQVLPGGNTRTVLHFAPYPLRFVKGEGSRLFDLDGHEYTDFLGEYTAGIYGHSHPTIVEAIWNATDAGLNLGGHNLAEAEFARAVCERFRLERVRFTNSGTEANLMAIMTARAFTGRRKIMVMDGGYHGGVLYYAHGGSPVNVPFATVVAPFNDIAATRALLRQHGPELAAVIVEPVLGSGGCVPAAPEFLQMLRAETEQSATFLILDEVMTSRLAPHGLGLEWGVKADLVTLGKYVGGGMSFGAFGGRAEVMEMYDPGRPDALPHAGTFNNNVLTMQVGLKAITEVYTPAAAAELNQRGDRLREALNALARKHHAPLRFTGLGSMTAAHFTPQPVHTSADLDLGDPNLKELFFFDLLEAGFYIARRGMIILSLPITDEDCDRLSASVEKFLIERKELLEGWAVVVND